MKTTQGPTFTESDSDCWVQLCGQPQGTPKDGDCCGVTLNGGCKKGKVVQNGTSCEVDTTQPNWLGISIITGLVILIAILIFVMGKTHGNNVNATAHLKSTK